MRRPLLLLPLLAFACATPNRAPTKAPAKRPLIVELPETHDVALFYGELEMLRRAVADFLRRRTELGVQPVPDLALEVVRGQLAKDRAECGAPSSRRALLDAQHPNAVYGDVTATCAERPCTLTVQLFGPPEEGSAARRQIARFRAEIADPSDANQWVNAVGALTPVPVPPQPTRGVLEPIDASAPPVRIEGVGTARPWKVGPTKEDLADAQGALDACHVQRGGIARPDRVSLEISPKGRVARCEGFSHLSNEGPERMKCLCQALSRVTFPPGPRGRRLQVRLLNRPGSPRRGVHVLALMRDLKVPRGYGFAAANLEDHDGPLYACVPQDSPKMQAHLRLRLAVDGTGHVTGAEVVGGDAPEALQACARAAATEIALPCPPGRTPTSVEVTYRFTVE